MGDPGRHLVPSWYAAYLDACNDRRWDDVRRHLSDEVRLDGEVVTAQEYAARLAALTAGHPDHRWDVDHGVRDGTWLAVRLRTRRGGLTGFELAHYRTNADGRIAEVWSVGTLAPGPVGPG